MTQRFALIKKTDVSLKLIHKTHTNLLKHLLPKTFIFFYLLITHQNTFSQVLHTENFNIVIDTTQRIKGDFAPNFRYRNLKKNFIELENTADISVLIKNHAFTLANRIEYSALGSENISSGGFIYVEYQNLKSKKFAPEPFFQMHWNEIRGLDRKYAGGLNIRWRAYVKNKTGLYFGLGSLYEYERWNYSSVPDELLPTDQTAIKVNRIRGNAYISFKQNFKDFLELDISGYYQPYFAFFRDSYRLAGSFEISYDFTKHLGIRLLYQNIYDSSPLVPIDKLYHDINIGVTIAF
jgi:hypothetical protein